MGAPEATEVIVGPSAFCSMVLHATTNPTKEVHGLLLGSFSKTTITVDDAVPVCHGSPTAPLVETAIGLMEVQELGKSIVGWYTAPMLLDDTKPGPVALRMATNLETDKIPSTLIVLKNTSLATCLKGGSDNDANEAVQAFGKDFGKQFQEAIKTTVENGAGACQALVEAEKKSIQSKDLEDNMMNPSLPWFPNKALSEVVAAEASDVL